MKERPILFSGAMVRAILEGRKTQTRRLVKPQAAKITESQERGRFFWFESDDDGAVTEGRCPYGQPGDQLWVRETWRRVGDMPDSQCTGPRDAMFHATATEAEHAIFKWKPSIHMPRWASRLTLRITDVRVQRLKDISEQDAIAEGATSKPNCNGFRSMYDGWSMDWPTTEPERGWKDVSLGSARSAFGAYINEIHGGPRWNCKPEPSLWDQNPLVWVVCFERVTSKPGESR